MSACPSLATGDAFLSSLLGHIDCQGETIGAAGYQALADPGSPISVALTGLLTIFIALFGFRMILGGAPSLRDGVMAIVKIGVVLLIATSWPAYRTVIYDVIVHGPVQLSRAIGQSSGLPGSDGDLTSRLQGADTAIVRLTTLGSGRNDLTAQNPVGPTGAATQPERAPLADDLAFGTARIAFLSSVVAAFALVRLGAGILLALAPLFAGLLLFNMGRGLFAGWLRALVFTVLGSITLAVLLGVELALLEPWLAQALRLRYANVVTAEAPIELLVLSLAFATALAGVFILILWLTFTVHVQVDLQKLAALKGPTDKAGGMQPPLAAGIGTGPARATAVANAVAAAQRRESASPAGRTMQRLRLSGATEAPAAASSTDGQMSKLAIRRRTPRKSPASTLRDRRS